jgi:glutamate synthase (NADPH/NADH) large chain
VAKALLAEWDDALAKFHKVMPRDYKRVLDVMREAEELDISESERLARVMAASHG